MKKDEKEVQSNKPIHKVRSGGITVSLWSNTFTNKDGQEFDRISFTIEKSYYDDKNSEWKSSNSYTLNEIQKLRTVLQNVYEHVVLTKEED